MRTLQDPPWGACVRARLRARPTGLAESRGGWRPRPGASWSPSKPLAAHRFLHHPRFHIHFIPTSSSWLNLVERFFGEITRKVIRPGSFRSVAALVADIFRFLDHHNLNPKPYRWSADPKRIL